MFPYKLLSVLNITYTYHLCVQQNYPLSLAYVQNPFHTFSRNFSVDGEAANSLRTCCGLVSDTAKINKSPTSPQQVVVMEFGKRHDTTDTTDFCLRRLVTDLLRGN